MIKKILENSKNLVLVLTVFIVLILNGSMLINPSWFQDGVALRISTILNFFSSIIFTWIFSEITLEKTFEEKQRLPAIRSYRQTKAIGDNVNFIIADIDRKISQSTNNYEYTLQLQEYRNLLSLILVHVNNIKLDWGDVVKDISILNGLEQVITEISYLSNKPDSKNNSIQLEKLRNQKKKLEEDLASINTNLHIAGEFSTSNPTSEEKHYIVVGKHEEVPTYVLKFITQIGVFEIETFEEQVTDIFTNTLVRINTKYVTILDNTSVLLVITCSGDLSQNDEFIIDKFKKGVQGIESIQVLNKIIINKEDNA